MPRPSSPKSFWTKFWRFGFVGAALTGLYFLLNHIGWSVIRGHASHLGWNAALALLVLGVAEAGVDALALRRGFSQPISLAYLYTVNQAGALLNRFIPLETGEVLKGALIARRVPMKSAISGTILYNYLFKLAKPITCMIALAAALAFGYDTVRGLAWYILPAAVLSFTPYLGLKVLVHFGIGRIFTKLVHFVGLGKKNPEEWIRGAQEVDNLVKDFWRDRRLDYLVVLGLQISGRIFSWASWYLVMTLIDRRYDLPTSGLIWTATILMGYIVGALPSRLGTTEAGGWALFKVLGMDPVVGLTTTGIMTLRAIAVNGLSALCLAFFDIRNQTSAADSGSSREESSR